MLKASRLFEAERELIEVEREMLCGDFMKDTRDPCLTNDQTFLPPFTCPVMHAGRRSWRVH